MREKVRDINSGRTGNAPPRGQSPRRLAAIVAGDIAGYSRLMEVDEEGTHERVKRIQRDLIDPSIAEHQGRLVKTTGDGFLAAFDSPGRAVRCALAFSEKMRHMGLAVRAGLHTGEIELRNGDIGGVTVHAAARVMAQAQANEVLVSRVVTDLVAGAGLKFAERGSHDLKGIPGKWDLFAAQA